MNKKIYILHENEEWTVHLTNRLDELGFPYESWHLHEGQVDLMSLPPMGVFYNRMSASSHTRNHRYAPELTGAVMDWLAFHGRKMINGRNALQLELSKVKQYMALEKHGIKVPQTIAAVGSKQIIEAAQNLKITPFIIKHNRAGKGLGVQLFQTVEALQMHLNSFAFEDSVDGITLVQAYVKAPDSYITRLEFINGKFLYSVRVRTDEGFELCPADACQMSSAFDPTPPTADLPMKFQIIDNPPAERVAKYEIFLKAVGIDVAAIECIEDQAGNIYTYDVNTNTNYHPDAERLKGTFAMLELAKYLGLELDKIK